VRAYLVTTSYEKGVKVTDEELATLNIHTHTICPQWNYTIYPRIACPTRTALGQVILL